MSGAKLYLKGLKRTTDFVTKTVTSSARKGVRAGLNSAGTVVAQAQRGAVPVAKTKGHNNESIKRAIGRKVFTNKGRLTMKSGVGVGKKKGTYRTSGVFLAAGTVDRFSGYKTIRQKRNGKYVIIRKEKTGNPVRFRGHVKKVDFIQRGYRSVRGAVRGIVNQKVKQVIARDAARRS